MPELFRNTVYGVLTAGLSPSDTTASLLAGHGARFGTIGAGDFIRANLITSSGQKEAVKITARSTDQLTITRAYDDSTALSFSAGDRIECRIGKSSMDGLAQVDHLQTNQKRFVVAGGTADAITATLTSNLTVLVNGQEVDVEVGAAITVSNPTLKVVLGATDTGAKTIKKGSGAALSLSDLPGANYPATFRYDSSLDCWILKNPAVGAAGGKQTVWIPGRAMVPRTTNGPANAQVETGSNKIMLAALDFDAVTQEFAQFQIAAPKGWDLGTMSAQFFWTAGSGAGTVVWGIQGLAHSDDDPLDAAFGAAQTVTDTLLSANDVHRSPETAAMTLAGSIAAEDLLTFQVYRNAGTLAVDARLLGVKLLFTMAGADDT